MTIKKLSSYRSVWMGIAMLWIMTFHSALFFDNTVLDFLKSIGYAGVDIFLFSAGLGSYFSYLRDEAPLEYLKRRIFRLAPVYLPFICFWMYYKHHMGQWSSNLIIGNLFAIQGFSSIGVFFNWYLTCIIICYILTPYLAIFIRDNRLIKSIILIILLLILSTTFWNDERFLIVASRVPIYVIGMIIAKYNYVKINTKHILSGIISFSIGIICVYLSFKHAHDYLRDYALYWYPFVLITPFLCYIFSVLAYYFEKNRITSVIITFLKKVGEYSFEIFLLHIFLFDFVCSRREIFLYVDTKWFWGVMFIITFLCSYILRIISLLIIKFFKSVFHH